MSAKSSKSTNSTNSAKSSGGAKSSSPSSRNMKDQKTSPSRVKSLFSKNRSSKNRLNPQSGTPEALPRDERNMVCDRLGFAGAEAYKLLRTNLLFVLPAEKKCRIIGVTSSIRGEGKSTTAINISYTLAETGREVLLIDADMRLPSVAKKLGTSLRPGLANVLAGMSDVGEALQQPLDMNNWNVMPGGDIPPNPSELLGSKQMQALLEKLSQKFDYIVIDLPPINIVTDALAVSPWIDGLLVVVREDYTDQSSVKACIKHLSVLESRKLLGFVMTDVSEKEKEYKRHYYKRYGRYYRHYGRYYRRYGKYQSYYSKEAYGYDSDYAAAAQQLKDEQK